MGACSSYREREGAYGGMTVFAKRVSASQDLLTRHTEDLNALTKGGKEADRDMPGRAPLRRCSL